jgi:hypothetical protein
VTTVVPFDDTNLARAALVRATEVSDASEEVVALTVSRSQRSSTTGTRGTVVGHSASGSSTTKTAPSGSLSSTRISPP